MNEPFNEKQAKAKDVKSLLSKLLKQGQTFFEDQSLEWRELMRSAEDETPQESLPLMSDLDAALLQPIGKRGSINYPRNSKWKEYKPRVDWTYVNTNQRKTV